LVVLQGRALVVQVEPACTDAAGVAPVGRPVAQTGAGRASEPHVAKARVAAAAGLEGAGGSRPAAPYALKARAEVAGLEGAGGSRPAAPYALKARAEVAGLEGMGDSSSVDSKPPVGRAEQRVERARAPPEVAEGGLVASKVLGSCCAGPAKPGLALT
jgi:hypothetical protein